MWWKSWWKFLFHTYKCLTKQKVEKLSLKLFEARESTVYWTFYQESLLCCIFYLFYSLLLCWSHINSHIYQLCNEFQKERNIHTYSECENKKQMKDKKKRVAYKLTSILKKKLNTFWWHREIIRLCRYIFITISSVTVRDGSLNKRNMYTNLIAIHKCFAKLLTIVIIVFPLCNICIILATPCNVIPINNYKHCKKTRNFWRIKKKFICKLWFCSSKSGFLAKLNFSNTHPTPLSKKRMQCEIDTQFNRR